MRTIIAGSRTVTDYRILLDALEHCTWLITTVISGTARGADQLGERYARENSIPVERYPAEWKIFGKRAGYLRNLKMAQNAEACIVLWRNESKGSAMMIRIAEQYKLELLVYKQVDKRWRVAQLSRSEKC